ncbi:pyruvate formate lyase family protein [Escherichia coli]
MYQQHLDKPIPVRCVLALAHHLANRTIWISKHDESIIGNQASESSRRADLPGIYCLVDSKKRLMIPRQIVPVPGFAVSEENKRVLHAVCPWWRGHT